MNTICEQCYCKVCGKWVNDGIFREGKCQSWYHHNCVGSDIDFNRLNNDNTNQWYCRPCQSLLYLLESSPTGDTSEAKRGTLVGTNLSTTLENVYLKVITWKFNNFKLPSGPEGRAYIEKRQDYGIFLRIKHYLSQSPY